MTNVDKRISFTITRGLTLDEFRNATKNAPGHAVISVDVQKGDRPYDSDWSTCALSWSEVFTDQDH